MQIAVLDKLPPFTFLLGTDFGKDRLLSLMAHVKVSPVPVRAMSADTELAKKTAQALHLSEGASPVALDDIVEVSETEPPLVSGPDQPVDVESPTPASNTVSVPTLTFDGVSKEEFLALQKSDLPLVELWNKAKNQTNNMFVAKGFLMSLTSTATTSHQPLLFLLL